MIASSPKRVALLIDADNTEASKCEQVFSVCAGYGKMVIRRAYGDFTSANASSWAKTIGKNGISPQQNYAVGKGKNAADISMVIDAMDMLSQNRADVFGIVSSDSDFTRLATRLCESGKTVIGIGKKTTPVSFKNACNIFHDLANNPVAKKPAKPEEKKDRRHQKALHVVLNALDDLQNATEWVQLSPLGKKISEKAPGFKYSELGCKQLSGVLKKLVDENIVELDRSGKKVRKLSGKG